MKTHTLLWIVAAAVAVGLTATVPARAAEEGEKIESLPPPEGMDAAETPACDPQQRAFGETFKEWSDKIKKPVEWFSWGADLRLRDIYIGNGIFLDEDLPFHERHFQRIRPRVWGSLHPTKDLDINMRLVWEWRHWNKPDRMPNGVGWDEWDWGENSVVDVAFDRANFVLRNVGDLPITMKVGRQDLIFGKGWVCLDGTPWDGSRTIFFDAGRLTFDLEDAKTKIDLVYLDQKADQDASWLRPLHEYGRGINGRIVEQDERGVILYVTNKALEPATLEGYFMMKAEDRAQAGPNDALSGREGEIYMFGGAASGPTPFCENLLYRVEGGHQFGHEFGNKVEAYGLVSRLDYLLKDKLNTSFRIGYEFLSGDDPNTRTDEAWDPMWGRWPQWSELYIYTYATESRIAEVTNLHRIGMGVTIHPMERMEWCNDYHLLWADENTLQNTVGFRSDDSFRGQLLASLLRYKFNDNISTHLLTEFFFPGDYYDSTRNDIASFLRGEIVFTW